MSEEKKNAPCVECGSYERNMLRFLQLNTGKLAIIINGREEHSIKNIHISLGVDYAVPVVTIEKYFDEVGPLKLENVEIELKNTK